MCANLPSVCLDYADYATGRCLSDQRFWLASAPATRPLTCAHVCVLAGMSVSTIKDGSGMLVHSVVQGGCVSHDGRLGVGDAILAINGEPTSNLTNARARAMLRRHSVLGPEMR